MLSFTVDLGTTNSYAPVVLSAHGLVAARYGYCLPRIWNDDLDVFGRFEPRTRPEHERHALHHLCQLLVKTWGAMKGEGQTREFVSPSATSDDKEDVEDDARMFSCADPTSPFESAHYHAYKLVKVSRLERPKEDHDVRSRHLLVEHGIVASSARPRDSVITTAHLPAPRFVPEEGRFVADPQAYELCVAQHVRKQRSPFLLRRLNVCYRFCSLLRIRAGQALVDRPQIRSGYYIKRRQGSLCTPSE